MSKVTCQAAMITVGMTCIYSMTFACLRVPFVRNCSGKALALRTLIL